MGRPNKGDVTKISIRLTAKAEAEIKRSATYLNISKAGVILFAMSKLLTEKPSRQEILSLESKYTLEKKNFAFTAARKVADKVTEYTEDLDIKKNTWLGLLLSDYFEKQMKEHLEGFVLDTEATKLFVEINADLYKILVKYSEDNFLPLNGLVAYSCLNGYNKTMPDYFTNKKETIHTTVPAYIHDIIKREADRMGITDKFYIELCLYRAFMSENKIFEVEKD